MEFYVVFEGRMSCIVFVYFGGIFVDILVLVFIFDVWKLDLDFEVEVDFFLYCIFVYR